MADARRAVKLAPGSADVADLAAPHIATIATTMPVANYKTYCKMLDRARAGRFAFPAIELVLEIETGAVGGEEDDVIGEKSAKLYTTPEDTLEVARRLNPIGGRYLLAATFGNVHGVYKPGHVKLKPGVLKECQDAVVKAHGECRTVLKS